MSFRYDVYMCGEHDPGTQRNLQTDSARLVLRTDGSVTDMGFLIAVWGKGVLIIYQQGRGLGLGRSLFSNKRILKHKKWL